MKRAFLGVAVICMISLSACGKTDFISRIQETEVPVPKGAMELERILLFSEPELADGYFFPQGVAAQTGQNEATLFYELCDLFFDDYINKKKIFP